MTGTSRLTNCRVALQLLILCALPWLGNAQTNLSSKDGYVRRAGNDWIVGTSLTERRLHLADGHLNLLSVRNKIPAENTLTQVILPTRSGSSPMTRMRVAPTGDGSSATCT